MTVHVFTPSDLHKEYSGRPFDVLKKYTIGNPTTFSFDFKECATFKVKSDIALENYNEDSKLLGGNINKINLFKVCQTERKRLKISEWDIVILLTDATHNHNMISCWDCSTRNGFVTLNYFDIDLKRDYLGICEIVQYHLFLVVTRIIQNMTFDESKLHNKDVKCIYGNFTSQIDLLKKMSQGVVCDSCSEKIKKSGLIEKEFTNLKLKFNVIAGVAGIAVTLFKNTQEHRIEIDKNLKITIPTISANEFLTEPLYKTIYLLFLRHPEGITFIDMSKHKDEIERIYSRLDIRDDPKLMKQSIDDITTTEREKNRFSEKKSRINRKISDLLGEQLAPKYRIEGEKGQPFKINLPSTLIEGLEHVDKLFAAK